MCCSKKDCECSAVHVKELFPLTCVSYAQCYGDAHRGKARVAHCLRKQAVPCFCASMEKQATYGSPHLGAALHGSAEQHSSILLCGQLHSCLPQAHRLWLALQGLAQHAGLGSCVLLQAGCLRAQVYNLGRPCYEW